MSDPRLTPSREATASEQALIARRRCREPLWREVLGAELRRLRHEQGHTLVETADRAGISPQYLSEIERGRKEPSSEMIAAVGGAVDVTLLDLAVADVVGAPQSSRATACVLALAA